MIRRFFDWLFGLTRPPDEPEVGGYFDVDTCDECGAELPPLEPGEGGSPLCEKCNPELIGTCSKCGDEVFDDCLDESGDLCDACYFDEDCDGD